MVALLRSFRVAQAVARSALAARPAARAFSLSAIRLGGAQPPELMYVSTTDSRLSTYAC